MIRVYVIYLWCLCCGLAINGQLLSQNLPREMRLDTLSIVGTRSELFLPGQKRVQIDSLTLHQFKGRNLADILVAQSDVFIKSYGLGSLATTSLRGGGASHTALVWNGIPLNSPMNGQWDLSLIPIFFQDRLAVEYGSAATLYGSGAVGGTIQLENHTAFGNGLRIGALSQVGSFSQLHQGLEVTLSKAHWYSRTRSFYQSANNDFRLPSSALTARQTNAALQQYGLLQEVGLQLNSQHQLHLRLWLQETDREIPPPLSSPISFAQQEDRLVNALATYQWRKKRFYLQLRSAFLKDYLHFKDSLAVIDAVNRSERIVQEVEGRIILHPQHHIHLGVNYTYQRANADGFGETTPHRHLGAIFGAYTYSAEQGNWEGSVNLRQAYASDLDIPFIPSISLTAYPLKLVGANNTTQHLSLFTNIGRSFRQPTFNDLFWEPGGNPDLAPEKGWHTDVGATWKLENPVNSISTDVAFFSQSIDNWILWQPGSSFWFPDNVREVWSRGIEWSYRWKMNRKQWNINAFTAYTFTRSTITAVQSTRDLSLNQQLIYTPEHQGRINLGLAFHHIQVGYLHSFTGKQYTTSDNLRTLPAFDVGRASIAYALSFASWHSLISVQLDNIWDELYQVIENRPMPGRSVLISLDIQFQQPLTPKK